MVTDFKARKYHLVLNNYELHDFSREKIIAILDDMHLDYYCLAEEIADSGTPHMHIFLYSAMNTMRFTTIKNRFPIAHISRAYGNLEENRLYIKKGGKWEDTEKAHTSIEGTFYEKGEVPSENAGKAPLMAKVMQMIEDGFRTSEIIREYPKLAFKTRDIDILRETLASEKYAKENRNVEVIYIYGETGTGKTSSVYAKHHPADVCRITSYKGDRILFDAYHGQTVLALEEFHSQIPLPDLLSILDIYPLMLPARYSDRVACYETVYIISNIPLSRQYIEYQRSDEKTWNALLRRIDIIREFHEDKTYTDMKVHEGGSAWIK